VVLEFFQQWHYFYTRAAPGCPEVEDEDFVFKGAFVVYPFFVAHWNGQCFPLDIILGVELGGVVWWPVGFCVELWIDLGDLALGGFWV